MKRFKFLLMATLLFSPLCLSSCSSFIMDKDPLEEESRNIYIDAVKGGYFKNYSSWKDELIGQENITNGVTIQSYQKVTDNDVEYKYDVFFSNDTKKELYISKNYYGLTGYDLYKHLNPTYSSSEGEWQEDLINNKLNDKSIYRVEIVNRLVESTMTNPNSVRYYKYNDEVYLDKSSNSNQETLIGYFDENDIKLENNPKVIHNMVISKKYDLNVKSIELVDRSYLESSHYANEPIYLDIMVNTPKGVIKGMDALDLINVDCGEGIYTNDHRTSPRIYFSTSGKKHISFRYLSKTFNKTIETSFETTILQDVKEINFQKDINIINASLPTNGYKATMLSKISGNLYSIGKNNTYALHFNGYGATCRFKVPIDQALIESREGYPLPVVVYGYLKNNEGYLEIDVDHYYTFDYLDDNTYPKFISESFLDNLISRSTNNKDTITDGIIAPELISGNFKYIGNGKFVTNDFSNNQYTFNISNSIDKFVNRFDSLEVNNIYRLEGSVIHFNTLTNEFELLVNNYEVAQINNAPQSFEIVPDKDTYYFGDNFTYTVNVNPAGSYNRITHSYAPSHEFIHENDQLIINAIGKLKIEFEIGYVRKTVEINVLPKEKDLISINDYMSMPLENRPETFFTYGILTIPSSTSSYNKRGILNDDEYGICFSYNPAHDYKQLNGKIVACHMMRTQDGGYIYGTICEISCVTPLPAKPLDVNDNTIIDSSKFYGRKLNITTTLLEGGAQYMNVYLGANHDKACTIYTSDLIGADVSINDEISFTAIASPKDSSRDCSLHNVKVINYVSKKKKIVIDATSLNLQDGISSKQNVDVGGLGISFRNISLKEGKMAFTKPLDPYSSSVQNDSRLWISTNEIIDIQWATLEGVSNQTYVLYPLISPTVSEDFEDNYGTNIPTSLNEFKYNFMPSTGGSQFRGLVLKYSNDKPEILHDLLISRIVIYY